MFFEPALQSDNFGEDSIMALLSADQTPKIIAMKLFNLSLGSMILRYYLMMVIVLIAGFTGLWWLAVLAFPVFISTILGFGTGK